MCVIMKENVLNQVPFNLVTSSNSKGTNEFLFKNEDFYKLFITIQIKDLRDPFIVVVLQHGNYKLNYKNEGISSSS